MTALAINFLDSYDNAAILAELKRIAGVTGKGTVSKADIQTHGHMSYELVNKRFGSLRKALEEADLTPQRYMNATDEELLSMLVDLWEQTPESDGRRPQRKDLKSHGFPVSSDTYTRRFGSWRAALRRACDSVHAGDAIVSSPQLPSSLAHTASVVAEPRSLSLRKRFLVMKRDSFSCVLCSASGQGVRLEVDHRVPKARGGSDDIDNLQMLCFGCNRGKRDSLE
jgi:hypothetical protein